MFLLFAILHAVVVLASIAILFTKKRNSFWGALAVAFLFSDIFTLAIVRHGMDVMVWPAGGPFLLGYYGFTLLTGPLAYLTIFPAVAALLVGIAIWRFSGLLNWRGALVWCASSCALALTLFQIYVAIELPRKANKVATSPYCYDQALAPSIINNGLSDFKGYHALMRDADSAYLYSFKRREFVEFNEAGSRYQLPFGPPPECGSGATLKN